MDLRGWKDRLEHRIWMDIIAKMDGGKEGYGPKIDGNGEGVGPKIDGGDKGFILGM